MVAAQSLEPTIVKVSPREAAVTVWAVFEALDMVPAVAEDQQHYLEARALVEDHLRRLGLPFERLRNAAEVVDLPFADFHARGDPGPAGSAPARPRGGRLLT